MRRALVISMRVLARLITKYSPAVGLASWRRGGSAAQGFTNECFVSAGTVPDCNEALPIFIIIGTNVSALSFSILVGTGSSAQVLEVECRMICLMSATVESVKTILPTRDGMTNGHVIPGNVSSRNTTGVS